MTDAQRRRERLEKECRVYTRYLTGLLPTDYVQQKYWAYCEDDSNSATLESDFFDELLVRISSWGPWWTRLADSYASRFYKDALLRKKLVLALALLECSPPAFQYLDRPDAGGSWRTCFCLAYQAGLYGAMLVLAASLLLPFHLALRVVEAVRPPRVE